jgi:hypothetical protein
MQLISVLFFRAESMLFKSYDAYMFTYSHILEQRDEPNTNYMYQHYKYKGIKKHKNIQVRQHKPRKRGVKPVPPKGSEHMKVI